MSVHNEYDSGVPIRFAWERLMAHPDTFALWGDADPEKAKIYETVNIPPKAPEDFLILSSNQNNVNLFGGVDEYIGEVGAILEVVNVRKFPFGNGSELVFSNPLKMLRRALCGFNGCPVYFSDETIGTEQIGMVDMAMFVGEIGLTRYRDGNFDVLHKGISIHLVWR